MELQPSEASAEEVCNERSVFQAIIVKNAWVEVVLKISVLAYGI